MGWVRGYSHLRPATWAQGLDGCGGLGIYIAMGWHLGTVRVDSCNTLGQGLAPAASRRKVPQGKRVLSVACFAHPPTSRCMHVSRGLVHQ